MRLCLILIIAISALSTEAAPNSALPTEAAPNEDKQEVSGSDKHQEGFENGYFGYGYGGGRGFARYGAYGPGYRFGYGYGGGNRQMDCCPEFFECCIIDIPTPPVGKK